jgi:hypothetical protein
MKESPMKKVLALVSLVLLALLVVAPASGQRRSGRGGVSVKSTLVALEKQAWDAWKRKDANFYRTFLTDDAINITREGIDSKAKVVEFTTNNKCEIRSYALDDGSFNVTMIDADAAIMTYKATQDYTCEGKPGPSPVIVSTVYVRRGGKWKNMLYHETQAEQ